MTTSALPLRSTEREGGVAVGLGVAVERGIAVPARRGRGSWLGCCRGTWHRRSCLKQRLPHEEALRREVQALVKERNAAQATIQWRFNTQDARTKLHRL